MKARRPHPVSVFLLGLAALSLGSVAVAGGGPETVEPRASDALELVRIAGSEAEGSVTLEAVLRPTVDAQVELEVLSPVNLRFATSRRSARYQLKRGGATHRERLEVELSGVGPTLVRVRAHFLNEAGERWMNVDREMRFRERAVDFDQVRVPVVRIAPDGSRTVEYMERGEAKRQSGAPTGSPAGEPPQADPPRSTGSLGASDPPPAPIIQE